LPCKELEARTFSDPRVTQAFDGVVALKADLTRDEDPMVQQLKRRFQIVGVPTIVFLDGSGSEQKALRLVQFEPPDAFLKRMAQFRSAAQTAKR
jgi:thiol:disulfide interchange protein DsbD